MNNSLLFIKFTSHKQTHTYKYKRILLWDALLNLGNFSSRVFLLLSTNSHNIRTNALPPCHTINKWVCAYIVENSGCAISRWCGRVIISWFLSESRSIFVCPWTKQFLFLVFHTWEETGRCNAGNCFAFTLE